MVLFVPTLECGDGADGLGLTGGPEDGGGHGAGAAFVEASEEDIVCDNGRKVGMESMVPSHSCPEISINICTSFFCVCGYMN